MNTLIQGSHLGHAVSGHIYEDVSREVKLRWKEPTLNVAMAFHRPGSWTYQKRGPTIEKQNLSVCFLMADTMWPVSHAPATVPSHWWEWTSCHHAFSILMDVDFLSLCLPTLINMNCLPPAFPTLMDRALLVSFPTFLLQQQSDRCTYLSWNTENSVWMIVLHLAIISVWDFRLFP